MKTINCIFLLFCMLYSCKQKNNIGNNGRQDSIKLTNDEKTIFDSVKTASLPYGNIMLIKNFNKVGSDFEVSETENSLLESEDSKFLSFYQDIFKNNKKPTEQLYKFSQKNIIDFGLDFITPLDSISTYQGYYVLAKHLPNVEKNKVFIFNSIESKENKNNISNNIDLVVIDERGKIIDNINLSRRLFVIDEKYENSYGDYCKYFYIDEDYIIHIKYFTGWGDTSTRVFAYVNYKIQKDGTIVRYFKQENGLYKSEVEEGMVKNHLKEGTWKEAGTYFEKMYYINEYKAGKPEKYLKLYLKHVDSESVYIIDRNNFKIIDQDFKMR